MFFACLPFTSFCFQVKDLSYYERGRERTVFFIFADWLSFSLSITILTFLKNMKNLETQTKSLETQLENAE